MEGQLEAIRQQLLNHAFTVCRWVPFPVGLRGGSTPVWGGRADLLGMNP
jgi:hypothetical protein